MSSVTVESIPNPENRLAFMVHGLYSPEECSAWVEQINRDGKFSIATINVGGGVQEVDTETRNHYRWMKDDVNLTASIWARLEQHVKVMWASHGGSRGEKTINKAAREAERDILGLNPRLRFLKYAPGEYFKPHYDGAFFLEGNADGSTPDTASRMTVLLYLNDGFTGGETTFLDENNFRFKQTVVPKVGSALVFMHDIFHEGCTLISGEKHVMRTDIMFRDVDW